MKSLITTLAVLCCLSAHPVHANTLTAAEWLEDLNFLVDTIKDRHYQPERTVASADLAAMHQSIADNLGVYSDAKIIAEMSKLVAQYQWGHTRFSLPVNHDHLGLHLGHNRERLPHAGVPMFSTLPVRFVQFEEGVFVESSTLEHKALLGQRLTHVGGVPVAQALQQLAAYVAHENPSALNLLAPSRLSVAELLLAEGLAQNNQAIQLTFADGQSVTLAAQPHDAKPTWVDYLSHHNIDKPLWLSRTDQGMWKIVTDAAFYTEVTQYYWYQFNPQNRTLYIKINYLFHHPEKSLAVFMHEAMQAADQQQAEKIIVDLRHSRGGSGDVTRAVKLALQRWHKTPEYGHVFLLVGRHSYSAAVMLALDIEKEMNAVIIGEEMGGKPQHIGDSQRFTLPNSGLTFRISVREHHDWTGLPDRSSVWIHYPTPMRFSEYRLGRDPALELAQNFTFKNTAAEAIRLYQNTNVNVALLLFYHLLTDPASATQDHSGLAHALAEYLYQEEGNVRFAQGLLNYNLEYYPKHIPSLLLSSQLHFEADDAEQGLKTLRQVLQLEPNNPIAQELLRQQSSE